MSKFLQFTKALPEVGFLYVRPEGVNAVMVHPKTGKVTYVCNTHRAYNTAPTLAGAITRFHKFIKGTA